MMSYPNLCIENWKISKCTANGITRHLIQLDIMIRPMNCWMNLLIYIISTGMTTSHRGQHYPAEIGVLSDCISASITITTQKDTAAMRPAITQRRHWLLAIRFTAPANQLRCWCG